jgi:hypothetical protein
MRKNVKKKIMNRKTAGSARATKMHSINSKPYGRSWACWAELWWQWCYSRPDEKTASDGCCEPYTIDHSYEKVWFLAGTFGGKASRKCEIPQGNSIFFPLINDIISFATDPHLRNESELCAYAEADLDQTLIPPTHLNIDGFEIPGIEKYRVQTSVFDIILPPRKPNSNRAGSWFSSQVPVATRAVSDGYWAFLKPFRRGVHRIAFVGEKLQYDNRIRNGFEQNIQVPKFRVDVTYQIYVS